jgi:hypothetical protein
MSGKGKEHKGKQNETTTFNVCLLCVQRGVVIQ